MSRPLISSAASEVDKGQSRIRGLRGCLDTICGPRKYPYPVGSQGGPPRNHPGETVYPQGPPGISSSGPKDKIGGVSRHACADSGLKSWV